MLSGQVILCTVVDYAVELDVVADAGELPAGTPFVVHAAIPSEPLRALVAPVVRLWTRQGRHVTACVRRHNDPARVAVMCGRTGFLLDVRDVALPPMPY